MIALTGIPVFREGNLLKIPHYTVEVAQACSGIRSLLTLLALGIAYAYFAERRIVLRILLVAMMLPIALLTNAFRILTACLLGYRFGEQSAEGFVHFFSGWLIFVVSLTLLYLTHVGCSRLISRTHV
jgi:exosortase